MAGASGSVKMGIRLVDDILIVRSLAADGPAHLAGVRVGDVVTHIGGIQQDGSRAISWTEVEGWHESRIPEVMRRCEGERVWLRLRRRGEPIEVCVRRDEEEVDAAPVGRWIRDDEVAATMEDAEQVRQETRAPRQEHREREEAELPSSTRGAARRSRDFEDVDCPLHQLELLLPARGENRRNGEAEVDEAKTPSSSSFAAAITSSTSSSSCSSSCSSSSSPPQNLLTSRSSPPTGGKICAAHQQDLPDKLTSLRLVEEATVKELELLIPENFRLLQQNLSSPSGVTQRRISSHRRAEEGEKATGRVSLLELKYLA